MGFETPRWRGRKVIKSLSISVLWWPMQLKTWGDRGQTEMTKSKRRGGGGGVCAWCQTPFPPSAPTDQRVYVLWHLVAFPSQKGVSVGTRQELGEIVNRCPEKDRSKNRIARACSVRCANDLWTTQEPGCTRASYRSKTLSAVAEVEGY